MENILNFKLDPLEKALLIDHSSSALRDLVEQGREVEFKMGEHICFISKFDTKMNYSLWVDEDEQAFSSLDELMGKAKIDGIDFMEVWPKTKIKTLY